MTTLSKIYTDLSTLGALVNYDSLAYNVYLAGPMTGYDQFNFPAFYRAAGMMRLEYPLWNIISPAEMDESFGLHPEHEGAEKTTAQDATTTNEVRSFYMRRDLPIVAACQAIVLLDGWSDSPGVAHELYVARACFLDIYRYSPRYGPGSADELQLYQVTDEVPDAV